MSKELLAALGEIAEYSGERAARVLLPESRYIASVETGDSGVSDTKDGEYMTDRQKDGSRTPVLDANGEAVLVGGSPFVELTVLVVEGPFEGCDFRSRFWLTPGRGKNIGYINNACKVLTGKPVDVAVLAKYGMAFPKGVQPAEAQQIIRRHFLSLDPQARLDFMVQYARITEWNGKVAVVSIGQEDGRPNTETGVTPVFNRIRGLFALSDPDNGEKNVRDVQYAKQTEAGIALGLLVEDTPTV